METKYLYRYVYICVYTKYVEENSSKSKFSYSTNFAYISRDILLTKGSYVVGTLVHCMLVRLEGLYGLSLILWIFSSCMLFLCYSCLYVKVASVWKLDSSLCCYVSIAIGKNIREYLTLNNGAVGILFIW